MVKNTLEVHRKLRKHHQGVRITKRQIMVKIQDLESKEPDFSLGTYMIKSNSAYTISLRVDLPKQSILWIDFWGLTPKLQRLSQARIINTVKDVRQKIHTFPKTKHIFLTFRLEEERDDPSPSSYVIHYLNIEAKYPLAKGVQTPEIPIVYYPQDIDLEIECHPKSLMEVDLDHPFEDLPLPINMKIFESSLLSYLLKRESGPHYYEALKDNIINCKVPMDLIYSNIWENVTVTKEILETQRTKINQLYEDVEKKMTTIDQLIDHKHSIESMLDQPDDSIHQKTEFEQKIQFYQKLVESLNLKHSHIKNLMELKNQRNLNTADRNNMAEILHYFENRILEDQKVIKDDLDEEERKWKAFQHETLAPKEDRLSRQQNSLDEILQNYRRQQKECHEMKKNLDSMIAKFVLAWYQWIMKLNYANALERTT